MSAGEFGGLPDGLHDLMLAVPCARCEALPRARCTTLSGKVALTHTARQAPILEAYGIGYGAGRDQRDWDRLP